MGPKCVFFLCDSLLWGREEGAIATALNFWFSKSICGVGGGGSGGCVRTDSDKKAILQYSFGVFWKETKQWSCPWPTLYIIGNVTICGVLTSLFTYHYVNQIGDGVDEHPDLFAVGLRVDSPRQTRQQPNTPGSVWGRPS